MLRSISVNLSAQLGLSPEQLESKKMNFYRRKFSLWVPMVHDFGILDDSDVVESVDVLPVDELLDRVVLRKVRVETIERSFVFVVSLFLFCIVLILQRAIPDSNELETAIQVAFSPLYAFLHIPQIKYIAVHDRKRNDTVLHCRNIE